MTVEEHLRIIIGDLVLRVAQLSAEVDRLKAPTAEVPEQPVLRKVPPVDPA